MIGRFICAALVVATLASAPAVAGSGSTTQIAWHRDGLLTWELVEHRATAPPTVHRLSLGLAPGSTKVISNGKAGIVEVRIWCAQRDGGKVHRTILASRVIRAAKPRVIAEGVGDASLASFEAHGAAHMAYMARSAIEMLATAYTADCYGCGGMTAIGRRAGHGIVAVDPHVIPLGTRLYIPGYGLAIAGDTGGDIVGHRIDLGFDSLRDAMLFGRRAILVYPLK